MRVLSLLVVLLPAAVPALAHPPQAGTVEVFAGGLEGPEGLAFDRRGGLVVGSVTGEIRRYRSDGSFTVLANVGEGLAGITVLRDGRVLACAFGAGRIWAVAPDGSASILASEVPGANFAVETARGTILASSSSANAIVNVTGGMPVSVATGLVFPNGLAVGRDRGRYLYVAETLRNRVSRLPLADDDTLGPPEVYATGLSFADGIAFDRDGNLLVVGLDTLFVVAAGTRAVSELSTDPLLDWPANLASGRGRGFRRRGLYLANFGPSFGDGTTMVRVRYNHRGARLQR